MGSLYRRKLKSGEESNVYWAKYYVNGRPVRESTRTEREADARRFLKLREGAVATGAPIPPRLDRLTYDELSADLMERYRATGRWKNLDDVENRLAHLSKFFKGHRAVTITPDVITRYIAKRQGETTQFNRLDAGGHLVPRCTANGTINLENWRCSVARSDFIILLEDASGTAVTPGHFLTHPLDLSLFSSAQFYLALSIPEGGRPCYNGRPLPSKNE